jgi:hypothetical protein
VSPSKEQQQAPRSHSKRQSPPHQVGSSHTLDLLSQPLIHKPPARDFVFPRQLTQARCDLMIELNEITALSNEQNTERSPSIRFSEGNVYPFTSPFSTFRIVGSLERNCAEALPAFALTSYGAAITTPVISLSLRTSETLAVMNTSG